mmetsp:Transcript_24041/g.55516  ORF Transcript_24041/g.55516 Transcript_24041/m.55516 type:complete len:240 (-) Transcript_24041:789-1508(-)
MICVSIQGVPRISDKRFTFTAVASLTQYTGSTIQTANKLLSSAVNCVSPRYWAKDGMQYRTASLPRHCRSLPRSLIAGSKDCDRTSTPRTVDNSPNVPTSFNLTSGLSSRIKCKKTPMRRSTVSWAPKIGARLRIDPAMLTLTCCDCSRGCVSFSRSGIKDSKKSLVGFTAATALMRAEAIIRTSTSWSESCCKKSGTMVVRALAWNTLQSCSMLSAMTYRTRQDLSSAQAFTTSKMLS